jgi:ABC-2 type transport system ATP-binding protein
MSANREGSAIVTSKLTKRYGTARGVNGIDLEIKTGEIFGFIGPNGAGKSTTIRMLMQLTRPTSGEITILGRRITGEQPSLRQEMGYLPSEVNLYPDLTGRQLLEFTSRSYGLDLASTPALLYADRLQFDMAKKVKSYSLGNRKKLGIIQSLLHTPKLLILDEPTSGLDPLIQHEFFELLSELNSKGMTIFFSTHVLTEVEKLCDRVAIIRDGSLIRTSRVDEVAGRNRRVIHVRYAQQGNLIDILGLRRIDSAVAYRGGAHIFTAHEPLHETLQAIASHPIDDIVIEKPSLEQLFMEYYDNDKGMS